MKKMTNSYILYCEICNWKKITDGSDIGDMYEYHTSQIPGGTPKLDSTSKKILQPKSRTQLRKFRCQNCGRQLTPKKIQRINDEQDRADGGQTSTT